MSEMPTKTYGPVEWPESVLEKVYTQPTDNDDRPVTRETVQGWLEYFDGEAEAFAHSHRSIVEKVTRA
jgi:hypothetical protein